MSLFRRPGVDTSSSDESSDSTHTGQEDTTNAGELNDLSRINTINSGASRSGRATPLSSRTPGLSRSSSHVRDLLLHSLLEEKTLREAAEHLNKDQSDPEVQELARNVSAIQCACCVKDSYRTCTILLFQNNLLTMIGT